MRYQTPLSPLDEALQKALFKAVEADDMLEIEAILKNGADPTGDDHNFSIAACQNRNIEVMKIFHDDYGREITPKDFYFAGGYNEDPIDGFTYASMHGRNEMIDFLRSKIKDEDREEYMKQAILGAFGDDKENLEFVKYLIALEPDMDLSGALHQAVNWDAPKLAYLLLQNGSKINKFTRETAYRRAEKKKENGCSHNEANKILEMLRNPPKIKKVTQIKINRKAEIMQDIERIKAKRNRFHDKCKTQQNPPKTIL